MKPLEGLRVLSLEVWGAGPYGSQLLAALGAEVIKIENPATGGDPARAVGPHFFGERDSQYFQAWNTSKRSVALDLKTDAGRSQFAELVKTADAVINNLRGDQPAKLGLEYATLGALNPARRLCAHLGVRPRQRARQLARLRLPDASRGGAHELDRRARRTAGALRAVDHRLHDGHDGDGRLAVVPVECCRVRARGATSTSRCSTSRCIS